MQSSAGNHRSGAPVRVARFLVVLFAVTGAASVVAQSSRDIIGAARLGSGYSQILNLTATPDINSAHLDISEGAVPQSLTVTRIPYEVSLFTLSDRNSIGWRVPAVTFVKRTNSRSTHRTARQAPSQASGRPSARRAACS
jgi:hypothetical protein